jgi:hypothetical protein
VVARRIARHSTGAIHGPEDRTLGDSGRKGPSIDRHLDPGWHRRRPDAAMLSPEIDYAPTDIALLGMHEMVQFNVPSMPHADVTYGGNALGLVSGVVQVNFRVPQTYYVPGSAYPEPIILYVGSTSVGGDLGPEIWIQ